MASAAEEACARLKQACARGDFAAVVAILHAHSADARGAGAAGAVEAVMAALRAHAADDNVANYSCLALRNLTCFKENTVKALSLGALDALIDVLQMHANNALHRRSASTGSSATHGRYVMTPHIKSLR
jgi:hypothetical protein